MENPQVVLMTMVGASIQRISDLMVSFRRTDTKDVLKAYDTIMQCEKRDTGCDPTPRCHVFWICNLSNATDVHIISQTEVENVRNVMEAEHTPEVLDDYDVDSFDPCVHALLCTNVSVASYLDGNPNHILGTNAHVVSPTFKHALVWWTCA